MGKHSSEGGQRGTVPVRGVNGEAFQWGGQCGSVPVRGVKEELFQ